MGFTSFFSKIGDSIKSVGNTIKNGFESGYHSVTNTISGAGNFIKTQADHGYATVNNIINQTGTLAKNIVSGTQNIVQNATNKFSGILSTPLILISAGIAGLLIFNSKDVSSVANNAINRV
jgi:hypothetical protein